MSHGLEVRDAAGVTTFNSTQAVGGCMAGVTVSGASALSFTFPAFPGRTAFAVPLDEPYAVPATVDTALGHPRVNTPATSTPIRYSVFIV